MSLLKNVSQMDHSSGSESCEVKLLPLIQKQEEKKSSSSINFATQRNSPDISSLLLKMKDSRILENSVSLLTNIPLEYAAPVPMKSEQHQAPCATHPECFASQFCISCSVTVCTLCTNHNAAHYLHKTIDLDELNEHKRRLCKQYIDVGKIIEKAKASFNAINKLMSSLNCTATMRIEKVNGLLDQVIAQVIAQVEEIRAACVTTILREAQTELAQTASSRERRKYAQYDKNRSVFRKRVGDFLNRSAGNITVLMDLEETGIPLHTLNIPTSNITTVPELSRVDSFSKRFRTSMLEVAERFQSEAKGWTLSGRDMNVMLIGGYFTPKKVMFYDCFKNTWSTGQPIAYGRWRHAAVTWNSKVIVAGGTLTEGNHSYTTDSVEQFDPQTNTWTAFPHLFCARYDHALVNFDGSLYAIGGYDKAKTPLRSAERYNDKTNSWELAFTLLTPRAELAAAALRNCIFITGGAGETIGSKQLFECETYRGPGRQNWIAPLNFCRSRHSAAAHVDAVYVFGGEFKDQNASLAPVEQYDRHADLWTDLHFRLGGLYNNIAACCYGQIYLLRMSSKVFDIFNEQTKQVTWCEVPEEVRFSAATSVQWFIKEPSKRPMVRTSFKKNPQLPYSSSKSLLVCVGGCDSLGKSKETSVYDVGGNSWHFIAKTITSRLEAVAVSWNNTVVIAGGLTESGATDSVEMFDPLAGKWTSLPKLQKARYSHALIIIDGALYVFGGRKKKKEEYKSVERYDAKKRKWELKGNFYVERARLSAAFCKSGVVLSGGNERVSCELFNTERCTSIVIAGLNISRYNHTSATHNDTVYVFGGYSQFNATCIAEIEQYDECGNTWTLLNVRLNEARRKLASVCIDGKIYIVGGHKRFYCSDLVDVFDPSYSQCTTVAKLPAAVRNLGVASVTVSADQCLRIYLPSEGNGSKK